MENKKSALEIFQSAFQGLRSSYTVNHLERLTDGQLASQGKKKTEITTMSRAVSPADYGAHLRGAYGIGISPVNGENRCFYAVVDIDVYTAECTQYVLGIVHDYDLPFFVFRSKSGGLHLYAFFREAESAKEVRRVLFRFVDTFALNTRYEDKVEVFPKQDVLPKDGHGSCVTLPYFRYDRTPNPMLAPDGTPVPFARAMAALDGSFTSVKDIGTKLDTLPYMDAPVCIQRALLSGTVGENSGRNDFLFSVAVYLKKRFGEGVAEHLAEINGALPAPLSDAEALQIAQSVQKGEYRYKCSSCQICKKFCSKKECALREYGVGRNKGHFTGIDFGQLVRMNSKDPYYVWELRVNDTDPYTKVVFKDEGELADQKQFLIHCIRYLNCAPTQVSPNDWLECVNTALSKMTVQAVSDSTDTTDLSQVHKAFIRFLVQKKAAGNQVYMIRVGAVVTDRSGFLCFSSEGFMAYLNSAHLGTKEMLLRDVLMRFGCEEGDIGYETKSGRRVVFKCWKKKSDEEIESEESILGDVVEGDAEAIDDAVAEAQAQKAEQDTSLEDEGGSNEADF